MRKTLKGQLPKHRLWQKQICLKGTLLVKFVMYLLCSRFFTCIIVFNLHNDPVVQMRSSGKIGNLTEVTKQRSGWARI